jgi:hypothetical protein
MRKIRLKGRSNSLDRQEGGAIFGHNKKSAESRGYLHAAAATCFGVRS